MSNYVLGFSEVDRTFLPLVGGKGANLGDLAQIDGVDVPDGFCVTTDAYRHATTRIAGLEELLAGLGSLDTNDLAAVGDLAGRIRARIEDSAVPAEIATQVAAYLDELGASTPYAVRSSATAEDLPTASFAGQQDTYLNVVGPDAILHHISRCWASLFSDRAVIYRVQNGIDHQTVLLSVVIQKMVFPQAAGVMFTADPITSDRLTVSINASYGLGEALVSGLVDPDLYTVRQGVVASKAIATKRLAIYARPEGGTHEVALNADQQQQQTLSDDQILQLARIGRLIERHFGSPQDIEWCLVDGGFFVVQSRPITTLFPVPTADDGHTHVFMSLSHQQLMTDVMRPLGQSMFQAWFRNLTREPTTSAGGRLYLDVSTDLSSPTTARIFVRTGLGSSDLLIANALSSLLDRKEYLKTLPRGRSLGITGGSPGQILSGLFQALSIYRRNDPTLLQDVIAAHTTTVAQLDQTISGRSGEDLFAAITQDMDDAYRQIVLDNYGIGIVQAYALSWLTRNVTKRLDENTATDVLAQSLPNNVTAQMGLDLLDIADVVRRHPAVLDYFEHADNQTFSTDLAGLDGGEEVAAALQRYLDTYGMRCPGEIDITRPRWAEQPTMLIPLIANNIANFAPDSRRALFQEGLDRATAMTNHIVEKLNQLPGGRAKAKKARRMIEVYRNFVGFREYPKYALMQRWFVYKKALLNEAVRLTDLGVLGAPDDADFLTFDEFRSVATTGRCDPDLIAGRRSDERAFAKLTPPRVITSDGEVVTGRYNTDSIPAGALAGVPVSSGIIEGRARIVRRLEDAHIEPGDILVTAFTDPSWTPLFVSIAGLVAEVGGMMTHGAVVAREYGLPAVVSVENATTRIREGQRVRVNGTAGYVELLN